MSQDKDFNDSKEKNGNERSYRNKDRDFGDGPKKKVSLFLKGLSKSTKAQDIRVEFEKFGAVRDVYLPRDYYTREPRGIAYVEFDDEATAEEARIKMDGQQLDGSTVDVQFAEGERKKPQDMKRKDRRGGRSPYQDRGRRSSRSRSRSPPRRRTSRSPPSRRRYSRSPSPPRRRYSRSPSPPRRRYSRSPSPPRRRRYSPSR